MTILFVGENFSKMNMEQHHPFFVHSTILVPTEERGCPISFQQLNSTKMRTDAVLPLACPRRVRGRSCRRLDMSRLASLFHSVPVRGTKHQKTGTK